MIMTIQKNTMVQRKLEVRIQAKVRVGVMVSVTFYVLGFYWWKKMNWFPCMRPWYENSLPSILKI